MFALPARVCTAADRSSQHIRSTAESNFPTNRIHAGREPGRFRYGRRFFCDSLDQRSGTGIKSRRSPLDCRSHRFDLVSRDVAVALRSGISQCALGSKRPARRVPPMRRAVPWHDPRQHACWLLPDRAVALPAPATASRSASARFSPSSSSATLSRSASFCRAASLSFNAFSKRSTGLSSRLKKNAIAISSRVVVIRRNQAGSTIICER